MGYMQELVPVPRPLRIDTNPPYYDWSESCYRAEEYAGPEFLLKAVRADLAAAKADGRLPKKLRTLVSLNRRYSDTLSLTIRGLTSSEVFDLLPATLSLIPAASGGRPSQVVKSGWGLNRDWAFVFLQAYLIADAYNQRSNQMGDDYGRQRYSCDLYVQDVGSFKDGHLMSIVDAS